MSKKPIIVFEGIEGSGKSHHVKLIVNFFKREKVDFLLLREPGGNPNSEKIRKLILDKKSKFQEKTDLLLYLAARNEHIKNKIKPALKKKKIVICDRFTDSTLAYQVYGKKVNKRFIDNINKFINIMN